MQPGGSAETPWPWLRQWQLRRQRNHRHSERAAGGDPSCDHGCADVEKVNCRLLFSFKGRLVTKPALFRFPGPAQPHTEFPGPPRPTTRRLQVLPLPPPKCCDLGGEM